MNAEIRRKELIKKLTKSNRPITGNNLASHFDVTRQVIVQDIAILRAGGNDILATSQGYILKNKMGMKTYSKTIACKHDLKNVREELMIIINHGAIVKDVKVEHPIYGEISGMLILQTSKDVDNFIKGIENTDASLLASLTDGVHLHTIEAINQEVIDLIIEKLDKKGFLLEK